MRGLILAMLAFLASPMATAQTATETLLPERRVILTRDADLPGGDITKIFDTTLEGCERACLADSRCVAFTFNSRNGACFPKSAAGDAAFYQGALSGQLVALAPKVRGAAADRRAELSFLMYHEFAEASQAAFALPNRLPLDGRALDDYLDAARQAEKDGDLAVARDLTGAALVLTDRPELWLDYARLSLQMARADQERRDQLRAEALSASINGYLRAGREAMRHSLLLTMGAALEGQGRGRETVKALRLAQDLQHRDDTAARLAKAAAKYGFRVMEHQVQADTARPRLCVTLSESLAAGEDYAKFVQLPEPGLTVVASGDRQLCVEGITHGQRLTVTLREGLPAADGQTLLKSVPITAYVRDRAPGARFPGRGYVLPAAGAAALPVETVNTEALELTLFQVSDRNLIRAVQNGWLGAPMPDYAAETFTTEMGQQVWQGTADVGMEVNRDITTRLPLDAALKDRPAGIYALRATVPGVDPYVIPAAWQWFVVSDLGLTTLSGVDGLHVFALGLGDAQPKAGVAVQLVSRANAVLGEAVTDDRGHAVFAAGLARGTGAAAPAMVVARQGEADIAFLSLTDPEFDLSDRGVEGREAAPPVDVFLTTDRGAYRAGEVVNVTALARDPQAAAVAGLPLTAVVSRPDGVEYARAVLTDRQGGYVHAQPIAGSAPRGGWKLELFADLTAGPLASRTFLVEDFLPERIDFAISRKGGDLRLGQMADLEVQADYLFGAAGADLAIEGEVVLRAAEALKGWPGYVFGRHDKPFDARIESLPAGLRTDAKGRAAFQAALPQVDDPSRPMEVQVVLRVAEGSGRPVERDLVQPLTPGTPLIGIKPLFDGVVAEGAEARFDLIVVGPDGKPLAQDVTWQLTRIETDYQWYQSYGNWSWEPVTTRTPVADGQARTGAQAVAIAAPVTWGEYELAVKGPEGMSSLTFWAGWYAPADASATPDTLELSLDKPAYRAGETARLRLVPRAAGTALVTVLSNRVVAMQAVQVTEGENLIDLPVTDEWGAGVYVTASVIRPMDAAAGRNPSRALGLTHAAIDPGARALKAVIEAPAEAAPRGPLDVAVKVEGVAAGDSAFVTLAAVDQGILNLTRFTPPDPAGHYFGQRKLGVGIRDIYGRLIDGLTGAQGTVRSGGDAGAQARLEGPPPTEELLAYFSGPLEVGADGYARTRFDLPAFNGQVKLMAVVWSGKGVGQASADVLVRDPVVMTASLPRFMAPGDDSRLLLEAVHASGPAGRVSLDVTAEGVKLGPVPSGFDLAEGARAVFEIPITATGEGLARLVVRMTTPDGKLLQKDMVLPVQVNDPEMMRMTRLDLAPGQEFTFDQAAFDGFRPGTARATLAIGPMARLNVPGMLASLSAYPYGCTEQMTSRAMPLLYLSQVAQAMGLADAALIETRISESVREVLQSQTAEGAFGLWSAMSGDMWLDAYVTDFLSRARAQGHAVPDQAFRRALDNLRNQVNYHADFDRGGEALAYALLVLAREGGAAVGDLRYYADVKGDAFATPLAQAQLGAALAAYGDQTRADAMFARAVRALEALPAQEARLWRADYGTHARDTAGLLALAAEAGSNAVNREALVTRLMRAGGTASTQEAAWTLMAAQALLADPGGAGITLNGVAPDGPLVRLLQGDGAPTVVANGSNAATTLTVTTFGVPERAAPAQGNGYAIRRSYYTLEGKETTLEGIKVGDRLVTVIEVTPTDKAEARLIVDDPLPAGFEIDNPNLLTGGSIARLEWLGLTDMVAHSEFRQDRFVTALDNYGDTVRLAYVVRAVSPGRFHHPAASVEDMYRPDYRATGAAGQVTIAE